MKKAYKALLISICIFTAAFTCLCFFAVRNGTFRISADKNYVEYYYFDIVKAGSADIFKDKTSFKIEKGHVIKKQDKSEFTLKVKNKKYLVKDGKTFSGLKDSYLYAHGRIDYKAYGLKNTDGKSLCFSGGKLFTGIYEKVYYTNGVKDTSINGRVIIDGKEYYFENGELFSGLSGNEYLTDGELDTSKDGFVTVDGTEYLFTKGKLFTGIFKKKYYLNGLFSSETTGKVKSSDKTYYVEKGVVYSGFKDNVMYKNGRPDKKYNGYYIIDETEYYFEKGKVITAPDSEPVKILLVGNSYTYYNGMGQMLCKFIKATGKSAVVVRVTKGGYSLRSLMTKTPAYAAWFDGKQIAAGDKKLSEVAATDFAQLDRAGRWDFIVVQNNDTLSKTDDGDIAFFNEYMKSVNSKEKILFNSVYYGSSLSRSRHKIINEVAETTGATVIDTLSYYSSYNSYFSRNWQKDLTVSDSPRHPSSKGAYLMALCIYTKLYGKDMLYGGGKNTYIPVYNSDSKFSDEFAPNKFKRKKHTTDYAMRITKSEAQSLQQYVSKYADNYLGQPLIKEESNDNEKNDRKN